MRLGVAGIRWSNRTHRRSHAFGRGARDYCRGVALCPYRKRVYARLWRRGGAFAAKAGAGASDVNAATATVYALQITTGVT